MRRFLERWLPPLVWMGLIFFVSGQPTVPKISENWIDLLIKKTGHAVAYGILAWLYFRALRVTSWRIGIVRALSVGLAMAYALSDEYHQTFVPGRNGALMDVAIDSLGAVVTMLLLRWREGKLS